MMMNTQTIGDFPDRRSPTACTAAITFPQLLVMDEPTGDGTPVGLGRGRDA